MITMYGIKNCDTIKKARQWLAAEGIDYQFHDYKKDGLSPELLDSFITDLGWEALLNKRGTSWRNVPDEIKNTITAESARELMLDNPSMIKRPLLDTQTQKVLGFKADDYAALNLK